MTHGSPDDPPPSEIPDTAAIAEGVRTIISATMRLADAVREDAERRAEERLRAADDEARRRVETARREAEEIARAERRRADRLDRVVERSETASAELAEVLRARRDLDEALTSLAAAVEDIARTAKEDDEASPRGALRARRSERSEPLSAEEPEGGSTQGPGAGGAAEPPDHGRTRGASAARLVAAQMALAGSSRAEVARHLRRAFDLPAMHEILDEVFEDREPRMPALRREEAR